MSKIEGLSAEEDHWDWYDNGPGSEVLKSKIHKQTHNRDVAPYPMPQYLKHWAIRKSQNSQWDYEIVFENTDNVVVGFDSHEENRFKELVEVHNKSY